MTQPPAWWTPPRRLEPTDYQSAVLVGLQGKSHVYQGTVPGVEVTRRRARNRAARRARRGNTSALRRAARLGHVRQPRFGRGQAPDPLGTHVVDAEIIIEEES